MDKDEEITHLKRKVASLTMALSTVDKDVARAAGTYLKGLPPGRVTFLDFLNELVIQVNQAVREDYKAGRLKILLTEEIMKKMDEKLEAAWPRYRKKLSEYLLLPVLVRPNDKEESIFKYRALSLRGNVRAANGLDPADAYANLKERLIARISEDENALLYKHLDREPEFRSAELFMTDDVLGYPVEVRLIR